MGVRGCVGLWRVLVCVRKGPRMARAEWRVNGAVVDGEVGGNGWDVTVGGGGGGESHNQVNRLPENTLVPCQPAQITPTACFLLASSFS